MARADLNTSSQLAIADGTNTSSYILEVALSKSTRNTGKDWARQDIKELRQLVRENTPTRVIGVKLGRTPAAVYNRASQEGISLRPTNQRPYGTKRKT